MHFYISSFIRFRKQYVTTYIALLIYTFRVIGFYALPRRSSLKTCINSSSWSWCIRLWLYGNKMTQLWYRSEIKYSYTLYTIIRTCPNIYNYLKCTVSHNCVLLCTFLLIYASLCVKSMQCHCYVCKYI